MDKITYQGVVNTDIPQLIKLCEAHAIYERSTYDKTGKQEALQRDIFSENPKLYCIVAKTENELVGYLTYTVQYSTWDAADYIYMDCLFVAEAFRDQRIGKKLMDEMVEKGRQKGIYQFQWQTPDFNEGAIRFYKRAGATAKSKERFFLNVER